MRKEKLAFPSFYFGLLEIQMVNRREMKRKRKKNTTTRYNNNNNNKNK